MKWFASRNLATAVLAVLAVFMLMGASSEKAPMQPNKLIILSTTDVKGKTSPCG